MPLVDIILLVVLAGFVFYGLFFGLIRTLGSLAGLVVGAWIASNFYLTVFEWIRNIFLSYGGAGKVITFLIIFTLTNRLVVFAFAMLDRTFDLISIIPFLKTINRLAGATFGLVEGGLFLGLSLYVLLDIPFLGAWLQRLSTGSQVMPYLVKFTQILKPLLPELLNKLRMISQA